MKITNKELTAAVITFTDDTELNNKKLFIADGLMLIPQDDETMDIIPLTNVKAIKGIRPPKKQSRQKEDNT